MRVWQRGLKLMVLFGWMALLAYWSDQGKLPIDQPAVASVLHGVQHKFAHFVAFGLLGILACWAVDGLPRATLWAVALTSAFGATDEWHQAFVPGRRSAIDDWALDTSAAMLAVYAMNRLRATRWRAYVRIVAPAAVAAAFIVGVGLAARPVALPNVHAATLRAAAHSALQLARDTRKAAQIAAQRSG
jgi:VanZ family protein